MQKKTLGMALAAILLAGGLAAYFSQLKPIPEPPPDMPAPAAVPMPPPAPAIRHPLNAPAADASAVAPLPELEQSDAPLLKALGRMLGGRPLALVLTDGVIRRIVATVDNLPRRHLPAAVIPLKSVPKVFATTGKGDSLAISSRNAARYARHMKLLRAVDATKLVAIYVRYYPLFQRAYEELGYPKAYFNDRLVDAIDDLLAAPELAGPIKLEQPGVLYEYAESALESRSAGQKIMIRMGRGNASEIKAKLREIRKLVSGSSGPS
ncbi:MAG: DUF3014 domain-containing protein [Burkholderiaceae bacterium]|nr:DUF3014 domain-containing protein [Burkholderiaceae bacterium]MCF8184973.1 DUF3014 domain-containing protein [Polynucleobacter sp.]